MSSAHETGFTAREAATQLDAHVETIRRWCRSGKIRARKNFHGVWVIDEAEIDALIWYQYEDHGS